MAGARRWRHIELEETDKTKRKRKNEQEVKVERGEGGRTKIREGRQKWKGRPRETKKNR